MVYYFAYITQTLHKRRYLITNRYKDITFRGNIEVYISIKTVSWLSFFYSAILHNTF